MKQTEKSPALGGAHCSAISVWPKINPACKYVVWLVETSKTSTTNPMTKPAAVQMMRKRLAAGKHATLIKAWSCVEARKLMANTEVSRREAKDTAQ